MFAYIFRTFKSIAFIWLLFSSLLAHAVTDPEILVTLGSRFTILSSDMGLEQFSRKPTVFIQYEENGKTLRRNLKVVKPCQFPSSHMVCEWPLSKLSEGAYGLWVQTASGTGEEYPVQMGQTLTVMGPEISAVYRTAHDGRIIVAGRFFGTRPPVVSLTYTEAAGNGEESVVERECTVLRPLAYSDGDGEAGSSCMDVDTGQSRLELELPDDLPAAGTFTIILQNRIGRDTTAYNYGQRLSAALTMAVSPENAGETTPPAGETTQVNTDLPVSIAADPAADYHFVRWEGTENAAIPDKVSQNTDIDVLWDATVTAYFEENPQAIQFDGICFSAGVRYTDPETGDALSRATLSWSPGTDDHTPAAEIKYHIYRGLTDDTADLYQAQNLATTLMGKTETVVDVPLSADINYFLVVAEDGEGNRNSNHRVTQVVQNDVEFKLSPKVLSETVSSEIHFDAFGTIYFAGDYSTSFQAGDVVSLDMGYWHSLRLINQVVVMDGTTYLDTENAPFDALIASGVLETQTRLPALEGTGTDSGNAEVLDDTTLDYSASFAPTLRTRAEYVAGALKGMSITLEGTFRLKGALETVFSGEYIQWNKPELIKQISVAKYYLGIIPVHQETEMVLDGYLQAKGTEGNRMGANLDFEKQIRLTLEWDRSNGWARNDESQAMTCSMPCSPDEPGDIDLDLILSPKLKATLNHHSVYEYRLKPQADVWALEIEKETGTEFQKFDLTCSARAATQVSYGLFSRDLLNTWEEEWVGDGDRQKIFSMPDMYDLGNTSMFVSQEKIIRIDWKEGVNNSVLGQNGADIWWTTTLNGIEYPYLRLRGAPYHEETYDTWHQDLSFLPKRLGEYQVRIMMKGDGFLGELGIVSDESAITVELPPSSNETTK